MKRLEEIRAYHNSLSGYVAHCKKTQSRDYEAERYVKDVGVLLEVLEEHCAALAKVEKTLNSTQTTSVDSLVTNMNPGIDNAGLTLVFNEVQSSKRELNRDENGRWEFDVEL